MPTTNRISPFLRVIKNSGGIYLKVAFVVKGFPPSTIGGTELATEKMAHYLTRAGIGVHVVTQRMAEEPVMEERDA